jgi:two-component system, NtrC family, nitrogen regulation sensor histidine kinase NtrY
MLTKRSLHILLTVCLLGLSVGLKFWYKDSVVLGSFASRISKDIAKHEADFESSLVKYELQLPSLLSTQSGLSLEKTDAILKELAQKRYTFLVYKSDSIVFWNNNYDLPQPEQLAALQNQASQTLLKLPFGHFYLIKKKQGDFDIACLVPIKYHFGSNQLERTHVFPASNTIPKEVQISDTDESGFTITNPSGQKIGSLNAPAGTVFEQPERVELLLFFCFILAYFSLTYNIGAEIAARQGMGLATIFLLSVLGLFFSLKIGLGLTNGFAGASVLSFSLKDFGNLGDLLLYLGILLWLMVFFHKENNKVRDKRNTNIGFRMVVATLNYLSVMMSVLISLVILKQLVFKSEFIFDFDNLFNLDKYNMLLIWGVIMMMGAMFLYSHKLMTSLNELGLPLKMRSLAIALSGLLLSLFYYFGFPFELPVGFVIFFTITYVLAFDVFIEKKKVDFYWVLIWIGLYSSYAAMILYHFNTIKDIETRTTYAQQLSIPRDSIAEIELMSLHAALSNDTALNMLFSAAPVTTPSELLKSHLRQVMKSESYLQLYYKPDIEVYSPDKTNQLDKQRFTYNQLVDTFYRMGQSVQGNDQIRHYGASPLTFRYTMHLSPHRLNIKGEPLDMYISFSRKSSPSSMVYNEVFFDRQYKNLAFLDRYDYAVFEKKVPVYQKGRISEALFDPRHFPDKNGSRNFLNANSTRSDLVFTDASGDVSVVVGRTTGNYWKKIYLASGIFTILSLFMLGLALINSFLVQFLPDYYKFYIKTRGSLSKRIQYYTVFLILVSLVSIGALTYFNFSDSSQKNEINKKDYLSDTMFKNLKRDLEKVPNHLDSQIVAVKRMLPEFVSLFDKDVDVYSASGRLMATSGQDLQHEGLLQQHMNSEAFYALSRKSYSEYLSTEKTAGIPFMRRYYALRNSKLQTIAYIGLPYYLPKHNINPANSDFIGKVLTAFVILLVIGVLLTIGISSSIIRPLETIIVKMKQQRMEEKHIPLVVDSDGEELVNLAVEYNNLILKIEDFTEKLAERERDLAWREMAAMVAHEIKNAMTTIKLSLQNVHEAKKTNDQETVNKFLDKAIYRNLMQVESLSRIAKDFGDFSMLQIPRRSPILLNKSVKDIFECFEEDKKVQYLLSLPKEDIYTLGDDDSFIRVINNLMLNAKEAIPDDREKRVEVALYRQEDRCFISVSDNGSGVPEDIQASIFTPKFSTKSSGTGLGLGICKQIIEALEGKIYFKTEKDRGTTFIVELPIVDKPENFDPNRLAANSAKKGNFIGH